MKFYNSYEIYNRSSPFIDVLENIPSIDVPNILGSSRFVVAIYCFFAMALMFYIRFNLSMALVCMTGTNTKESNSSSAIQGEFEDWNPSIVSNLLSFYFFGFITTQVIGGRISDRFGSKYSLIGGILCLSITSILVPSLTRFVYKFLFYPWSFWHFTDAGYIGDYWQL